MFYILKNLKAYRYFKKRKKGVVTIDGTRGCGYYIPIGFINSNNLGKIETWTTKSNKEVTMKLIDYTTYSDPWDMIKISYWQLIGYVDEPNIEDCTFKEFVDIYAKGLKLIK